MNKAKRAKLEALGWKLGSVQDFLGLSEEEAALVELKVSFGQTLRHWRTKNRLTQSELAKRLKSSVATTPRCSPPGYGESYRGAPRTSGCFAPVLTRPRVQITLYPESPCPVHSEGDHRLKLGAGIV